MKAIRALITHPALPDGVHRPADPRAGGGEPWTVEIMRGADGSPLMRDLANGRDLTAEDLTPFAQLRVIDPLDDEQRDVVDALVEEWGLPLAGSPLDGGTGPH